jgi:nifR3 family TIM-barrel protein
MNSTATVQTEQLKTDPMGFAKPWLFLAPLAGVTDWAFREICYATGAETTVMPLIPAAAFQGRRKRILAKMGPYHGEQSLVAQIYGKVPEDFRRAAQILSEELPIGGIDINMGCPMHQIVSSSHGAALLKDPELAEAIVAAARKGTPGRLSVKIRSGWDSVVAPELAKRLEAAGADYLIIHGRTREQLYHGEASLEVIAAVKQAVNIPVIGNGDIVSVEAAKRMLAETGVDGLMIGRGVLGNPWLFGELQAELKGNRAFLSGPEVKATMIRQHVANAFEAEGNHAALTLRKHLMAYSKGVNGAGQLRRKVEHVHNQKDVDAWVDELEAAGQEHSFQN